MNNDAIIAVLIAMLLIYTAVIIRAVVEIGICDDIIEDLYKQLGEKYSSNQLEKESNRHE